MSGKINNVLQVMGHIIGTLCIPLRLVELIGSNTTQRSVNCYLPQLKSLFY